MGAIKKITTDQDGRQRSDVEKLLAASFGKGNPGAQFLAALMALCIASPPRTESKREALLRMTAREKLKKAILEVVWNALRKGDGQLLRDLGDAVEEQKSNPKGHDPLPAALLAGKLRGRRPPSICAIQAGLKAAGLAVPSDTHVKRIRKELGVQPQGGKPGHPLKKLPSKKPLSSGDLHKVSVQLGLLLPKVRKPCWAK